MSTKKKDKRVKSRNWHAVNAQFRHGGAFRNKKAYRRNPKHRNRGGE